MGHIGCDFVAPLFDALVVADNYPGKKAECRRGKGLLVAAISARYSWILRTMANGLGSMPVFSVLELFGGRL